VLQDLTVKIASQCGEEEISLDDDELQRSTVNVESFVDEQEWRLYDEVETFRGCVSKFYQGDSDSNCVHPTFSCRTHATRRAGFYITNIFIVMVPPPSLSTIRCDTRCYFSLRSKANTSQLNLPHGTDNEKV